MIRGDRTGARAIELRSRKWHEVSMAHDRSAATPRAGCDHVTQANSGNPVHRGGVLLRRAAMVVMGAAAICAVALTAGRARACASCGCGDPTLTTMGDELAFAGRVRLSLSLRGRTDRVGRPGIDATYVQEATLHAAVAWSPLDWLTLALDVPVVARILGYPNGGGDRFVGLGDAEARARVVVWRDRAFAPSHRVAIDLGTQVPTSIERDAPGMWAQPGTGAFEPIAGVSYTHLAAPWSLFASLALHWPTEGRDDRRDGRSVRGSVRVQRALGSRFAIGLGLDGRADEVTLEDGVRERDSGGVVVFASSSVSWAPAEDLLVVLDVFVPALNALRGAHAEGPASWLGVVYDL